MIDEEVFISKLTDLEVFRKGKGSCSIDGHISFEKADLIYIQDRFQYILHQCETALIRDVTDIWIHPDYSIYTLLQSFMFLTCAVSVSSDLERKTLSQQIFSDILNIWTFLQSLDEFDQIQAASEVKISSINVFFNGIQRISFLQACKFW